MPPRVLAASTPEAIAEAHALLRQELVVAVPTETVYGLACLPVPSALERLVAIKRRSVDKGIALLIDSVEQARGLAIVPDVAERLAARFWPGALTLVLEARPEAGLPELLTGGRPTIGLRLPDHHVPRELCRRLGPIAASSANVSGQPDATTAGQVLRTLGDDVALVLDDGPSRGGQPSTVVAVPGSGGAPQVLRHGAIPDAAIHAAAG